MASVGQRISFLKILYDFKVNQGIPIAQDDYVPESVTRRTEPRHAYGPWATNARLTDEIHRIATIIKDRDMTVKNLSTELTRVSDEMAQLKRELEPVWKLVAEYKNFKVDKKKSNDNKASLPNLKAISGALSGSTSATSLRRSQSAKLMKSTSLESLSLKPTTTNSPTSPLNSSPFPMVVDAENNTTLRLYADGLPGHETESFKGFRVGWTDSCRQLLPVALKKYKIFHEQRQYAIFLRSNNTERCLRFDERPMAIQKHLLEAGEIPRFLLKHIKQQPNYPIRSAASIAAGSTPTSSLQSIPISSASFLHDSLLAVKSPVSITPLSQSPTNTSNAGVSIAIYEYSAEREDELNVHIGDRFMKLHSETGWCVVERGDGRRGWVPEGCLLSENEEEGDAMEVLPRVGKALDDYAPMSPNELSVKRGEVLTCVKKYRHWVLAESNGHRGWLPSCYVSSSSSDTQSEESESGHEIVALPSSEDLTTSMEKPSSSMRSTEVLQTVNEDDPAPVTTPTQTNPHTLFSNPATPTQSSAQYYRSMETATVKRAPSSRDTGLEISSGAGSAAAILSPGSEISAAMSKLDNLLDSLRSMGDDTQVASPVASSFYSPISPAPTSAPHRDLPEPPKADEATAPADRLETALLAIQTQLSRLEAVSETTVRQSVVTLYQPNAKGTSDTEHNHYRNEEQKKIDQAVLDLASAQSLLTTIISLLNQQPFTPERLLQICSTLEETAESSRSKIVDLASATTSPKIITASLDSNTHSTEEETIRQQQREQEDVKAYNRGQILQASIDDVYAGLAMVYNLLEEDGRISRSRSHSVTLGHGSARTSMTTKATLANAHANYHA
ncbi:hypothetical protein SmJEL517_g02976 [Synchytrium microbalum]|uniref:SH3 domain-containing protein n=1 Tax=Synchytrium microbalum TaxID=1806994 RepID=A0A507CA30_9FUNG|nr:uncharacterized protein SmJEL517_g02976 [Synchytrium microbalum]TPX34403.1 hypothetical protein SmJEL517_g02976 [Synchytrium microbalum]